MTEKPLYLTTTLPYVNAKPHIGYALEVVQADAVARAARLAGRNVFFNIGTDEHGQKIWEKAGEAGKDVQDYVDGYAAEFKTLRETLDLSFDAFIRTTDENHIIAAQEMWRRCMAKGDIYKAEYETKYCVGCELEKTDSELDNGKCPLHPGKDLEIRKEENYFFKFSNYEEALQKLWSNQEFLLPDYRLNEMRSLVKHKGLQDFSISRPAEKMPWGVPVPDDADHVMYVWFDALVNYISTLGWPEESGDYQKFWKEGERRQFAGKDQVRQQAAMWQAMLLSAGLPTTDNIFIHGFINSGGQKMSKSLGNVIDPVEVVAQYGTDALRYFLLRHIHPTEDSDWTAERFHESYMAHLVNGIGNLTNRVLKMAESYGAELGDKPESTVPYQQIVNCDFNTYLDTVWAMISHMDEFITDEAPFKKVKTDPDAAADDVRYLLEKLFVVAKHLEPVLPETAEKILHAIDLNHKPEQPLFPRVELE